jgi:hypothetical protein
MNVEENTCFKRKKRSYSNETILEYSDSDSEEFVFNPKNRRNVIDFNGFNNSIISTANNLNSIKDDNDLVEILSNINKLNIDSNKDLFTKIIQKIGDLEKKVETLQTVNIKIDMLKKDIDKILVEKDYVIENLKYEINDLKDQLKESNSNFDSITHHTINNCYYS